MTDEHKKIIDRATAYIRRCEPPSPGQLAQNRLGRICPGLLKFGEFTADELVDLLRQHYDTASVWSDQTPRSAADQAIQRKPPDDNIVIH